MAMRLPNGRYHAIFEPIEYELTGDREGDTESIVRAYTLHLESWVRRVPEQYFWHHRRWKHQPPDTLANVGTTE
jgi:KDO2-lipid IV(A) lauroyltransferase